MKDMVQVQRGGTRSYEGPKVNIGRSQFNRSHGLLTTFDASYIYPIFVDEILPGDTMTMKLNGFCRIFSPLKAPVFSGIQLETFFFFVPSRLLWDNWAFMHGEHVGIGAQDQSFTVPVLASGWTVDHDNVKTGHGLAAHMGLPHGLATATVTGVNSLPFRCYNRIYNEFFRDQNLKAEVPMVTTDTADPVGSYALLKSNKKHDYFTSALPYLQKGSAGTVALQGVTDLRTVSQVASHVSVVADAAGTPTAQEMDIQSGNLGIDATAGTATEQLYIDLSIEGAAASGVPSIDINALRQSLAIQRLLEKDARGGTRLTELIKTHFGVTVPDFRLQRPEYLGGGKANINITPVAATTGIKAASSPDAADSNVGELRGIGTGVISGHGWAKSFTEHGYVLGLMRTRGDLTYWEGMERFWSRSTRYDFYIPALANLGEMSILNQELFVSNSSATDIGVFGYQSRWEEYRTKPSRLAGNFNPDVSGSLQHWHLAEDFGSLPALNTAFMHDQTPMSRITTVVSEPDFLMDLWFDYKCARPIPVTSIPSIIGRF